MTRVFQPRSQLPAHVHSAGVRRRELLQVGYSGLLGMGLETLLQGRSTVTAADSHRSPRQVVIVFLTGAASHHETFDMKPEAPKEIRGDFNPVETSVPGMFISEHLPLLAQRAHQYALVRTLSHSDNNHLMSTHHVLTGAKQPGGFFDKVASRDDWPSYASALAFLNPRNDGIPSGINLPTFLLQGPLTWPGQHAGFLGPNFDPWQITSDPNKKDFKVDALSLSPGIDVNRLGQRKTLLDSVNRQQRTFGDVAQSRRMTSDQELAVSMLTSSHLAKAFEIHRESESVRDRYGRHTTGQSLLLARRLLEADVPIVQANIGRVQNWDSHSNIFPRLKDQLLPPLDQGVAALLDDLSSSGRLEDTLVLMLGEFGRTPKINGNRGRDHWGPCFFGFFAGAGVQGGQVIGRSDESAAYPATRPYSPNDVGATVYQLLGIPAGAIVQDRLNRPVHLNTGEVIDPLFSGASS
ncbi:MAG: DUF1501 domain-containing protein [Planctomycetaceae bacterium]